MNEIDEKLERIEKRLKAIEKKVPKLAAWSKASLDYQKMRLALDVAATSRDVEEAKQRIKMLKELVKEMADA
jgi:archaellum component FlaC